MIIAAADPLARHVLVHDADGADVTRSTYEVDPATGEAGAFHRDAEGHIRLMDGEVPRRHLHGCRVSLREGAPAWARKRLAAARSAR